MRRVRFVKYGLLITLAFVGACKSRSNIAGLKDAEGDQPSSTPEAPSGDDKFFKEGAFTWDYDGGPDAGDGKAPIPNPMGKELIDLRAAIPSFPNLSMAIYGDQMFR